MFETPALRVCNSATLKRTVCECQQGSKQQLCNSATLKSPPSRMRTQGIENRNNNIAVGGIRVAELQTCKTPPSQVTILKHCRCQDCRHWLRAPYAMCRHGLVVNGVKAIPEYPADEWHYCAMYHGPQVSKEVWVWPRALPCREAMMRVQPSEKGETA